jgi:ribonucleotide reductase beta subunit family protein with ferritin-like domain
MYRLGKEQESRFWSANELKSFTIDRMHYRTRMNKPRRKMLERVGIFFLPVDGVVNTGHMRRTAEECKDPSEQYAMAMQIAIEAVHGETYGMSIQIIFGNERLMKLKRKAESIEIIQDKIKFGEKYMKDCSLCEYLLAFACTEGILISTSFIFIFWFRSQGLIPGLIHANSMISEDEKLHQEIANKRYLKYGGLSPERATEIIMEAMALEERYIDWVLPEPIDDLNAEDVKTYLKLVVDYQLVSIGLPKMFEVENPFSWDADRSLYKKPNPYERDSGKYCRFSVDEHLQKVFSEIDGCYDELDNLHLEDPWSVAGL